ncbi:MAG: dihydroorotate dehydrogenase electron transfer subunit [Candidatus Omnitrophota bacterium]
MIHTRAEILLNQQIIPGHNKLILKVEGLTTLPRAGQFFHIKAGTDYDPLLRRPISVHRVSSNPNIVEMLYKIVGKGTHLLSRRSKGTFIDVVGPLGNGFKVPKAQSNFILVAGGIGIAPLVALADELAKFRKKTITVILGVKTKSHITCKLELEELGAKVVIVTEDGSAGVKGFSSCVLEDVIKQFDLREGSPALKVKNPSSVTISDYRPEAGLYACGPIPMLKEVCKIAHRYRIETQVSLEERMGCGIGACLGCVVNTTSGYKRVCKDGPVFRLEDIVW